MKIYLNKNRGGGGGGAASGMKAYLSDTIDTITPDMYAGLTLSHKHFINHFPTDSPIKTIEVDNTWNQGYTTGDTSVYTTRDCWLNWDRKVLIKSGTTFTTLNLLKPMNSSALSITQVEFEGDTIPSYMFYMWKETSGISTYKVPDNISTISSFAFQGVDFGTDVRVELNNTKELKTVAFYGVSGMTSIDLGNSLESIARNMFIDASIAGDLVIPASVKTIDDSAFENTKISSATLKCAFPYTATSKNAAYIFQSCTALTAVTISPEVKSDSSIGIGAFKNCTSLKTLTIENCGKFNFYGGMIFKNCTALTDITINTDAMATYFSSSTFQSLTLANINLHVPSALVDTYKADAVWGQMNVVAIA